MASHRVESLLKYREKASLSGDMGEIPQEATSHARKSDFLPKREQTLDRVYCQPLQLLDREETDLSGCWEIQR